MKKAKILVIAFVALGTLAVVGGLIVIASFSSDLPKLDSLTDYRPKLVTTIYSRENKVLASYAEERRVYMPVGEMPENVVNAFVAAEDDQFFSHVGINPVTILRAAYQNFRAGRKVQGGSTITQQVAKTFLLSSEKSYTRKIKEALLAFQIERALSKDQILNLYLNQIFLGQNSYGVEAASLTYFGKSAKDLSIAEAAVLAGLPKAPSNDNPVKDPKMATQRKQYVLGRMLETQKISSAEYEEAKAEELRIVTNPSSISNPTPYLSEYVRRRLVEKYGDERVSQGLSVYTTVAYDHQIAAQDALDKGLREVDKRLGLRRPEKSLSGDKAIDTFLAEQHKDLISKFYNYRVIDAQGEMHEPVAIDTPTPIELGENYEGVVISKNRKERSIRVQIGNRFGDIQPEFYQWAMEANQEEVYGEKIIRNPYTEYRKGDVITVQAASFKEDKDGLASEATKQELILKLEQQPLVQGALVSYNVKTGALEALVGGYDFHITNSHFNRAVQAIRQPGSTFKPFVYGTAINAGLTPSTIIVDSPIVYSSKEEESEIQKYWKPNNYGERFYGDTTLRNAIAFSRNIPTIKLAQYLKISNIIEFAHKLGITSELAPDLSSALGSSAVGVDEMVRAWSIFANQGIQPKHHYIQKVLDWEGNILEEFGKTAEEIAEINKQKGNPNFVPPEPKESGDPTETLEKTANLADDSEAEDKDRVIDEKVAYLVTSLLQSVVNYGTATSVQALKRPVAGKTGTTSDFKDAWFIGYTPQLITGTWVGFDGSRPIGRNETGGRAAAPIWMDYSSKALKDEPVLDFETPAGILQVKVDSETGDVPTQETKKVITEYFIDGNAPGQTAKSDETDPLQSLTNDQPRVLRTQVITGNPDLSPSTNQNFGGEEGTSGMDELLREDL